MYCYAVKNVHGTEKQGDRDWAANLDATSTTVHENTEWDEHGAGLHGNTCTYRVQQ